MPPEQEQGRGDETGALASMESNEQSNLSTPRAALARNTPAHKSRVTMLRSLTGAAAGALISFAAHASNCSGLPVSGKTYNIVNEGSGLYLDVAGASTANEASVILWPSNGQTNQQWTVTDLGNGAWSIRPVHSKKSMDVSRWSTADRGVINQWEHYDYGSANQQWVLTRTNSGSVSIASHYSKKLVTAGGSDKGTAIYQHSDQTSPFQRWYFNPIDGRCASTGLGAPLMGSSTILIGGMIADSTANAAPFDVRYQYLHSQPAPFPACYQNCFDGCNARGWWGCQGTWNQSESGVYVTWWNDHVTKATWQGSARPQIQYWTWYSLRDLGDAAGHGDGPDEVAAIQNPELLTGYLNDFRFFLSKIGDSRSMVHLEPDFWGFVRAKSSDPHKLWAPVSSANPTDCAKEEDSAAGLASCLISMVRRYAPQSTVGLHASCWDYLQADGPQKCAQFMRDLGAGKGDFIVTDASDRDAGWYDLHNNPWSWWNDQTFATYLAVIKTLTETVGKPMVVWQIPLGNMAQNNTFQHYKDNKVDYFFSRINEVAAAHVAALLFGAGHQEQTTPETDGGNLINKTINYRKSGGVPLR